MAEAWKLDGLCREVGDPDQWFPESGRAVAAQKLCQGCSVKDECLEYALTEEMAYGVWGGKSVMERRAILKERGLTLPGSRDPNRRR